jgi:CspA family cold shock protein
MNTGTVKWFSDQKGYGFIKLDGEDKDIFVHITAVEQSGLQGLREGQKVSFDVETNPKNNKANAINLKAAD